mmetsp:Transcript_40828/g.50304  ORF Transcript_40828/g.50304 Transcript_40828/m.50304 type:complete len:113 (+) Transcript_40828:740-1078(+)
MYSSTSNAGYWSEYAAFAIHADSNHTVCASYKNRQSSQAMNIHTTLAVLTDMLNVTNVKNIIVILKIDGDIVSDFNAYNLYDVTNVIYSAAINTNVSTTNVAISRENNSLHA